MSVNINLSGGLDIWEYHVPSSTGKETAKTVEDNQTILGGWLLANNTAGTVTFVLSYNDGVTDVDFYVKQVAAHDTVIESGFNMRLVKNGVISCTSSASSGVSFGMQTVIAVADTPYASNISNR